MSPDDDDDDDDVFDLEKMYEVLRSRREHVDEEFGDSETLFNVLDAKRRRGNRLGTYVLDEHGNPKPEPDLMAWGLWMEHHNEERIVAHDRDEGRNSSEETRISVSTVFIGVDHSWNPNGPPLLYETMVFNGELNDTQMRYATREEALAGHQIICNAVMQTLPKRDE